METIGEVEECLQDGLPHLYSPTYQPPELLWTVTGSTPQQGAEAVQAAIIEAIEDLRPAPDVPPNARVRRLYELLSYRYIQGLTQKETARRLSITSRHLRREQREAVHLLAQRLWEQRPVQTPSAGPSADKNPPPPETTGTDTKSVAWRSQIKQELASLQQSAPGTVADVGATIHGAVKSGHTLASKHGVKVGVELIQQNLMAKIHPSVLREILITTIEKLAHHMSSGEITLRAEREGESIKISITGYPTTAEAPPHSDFIWEALTAQGGSVNVQLEDNAVVFLVLLPAADKTTVAVVEDNADLVHFYRHYTTRTRYQIVHVAETQHAFEAIVELRPDIIVLDIMLPDIDGWELLAQLHEHPTTRLIPVIVCSVVRREELALAFGAVLYVQKPIRRQQFIQALDQALGQASARAPRVEANNSATY